MGLPFFVVFVASSHLLETYVRVVLSQSIVLVLQDFDLDVLDFCFALCLF